MAGRHQKWPIWGVTLEEKLRRSNPWARERCGRPNCFPCQTDEGGDCWREGITYSIICEECGEEVAAYFGESGRNGYTRGGEHLTNRLAEDENRSVLKLHANQHHNGAEVRFSMRVTGVHNDSLDRGSTLPTSEGEFLMNRRGELGGVRIERQRYRRWGADQ